uniref:IQ motif containing N n=1 Tax=Rhinolophus ferrumequinum TaxID=59479 RepID=A0A671G3X5_RHIFE
MLAQPVPNLQDKAGTLRPHPQHEPPASRETLLQQPDKMVPHHTPRLRAVVESQAFKNVLVDEMDIILSRAATLIQSNWKGYRLRQKLISQMRAAKAIQEAWRRFNTRRLLRFGKAVEKKVSADEGDIPYHPPQQVRFQHSEKDRSLSAPPIMVSKETQFPSADSLAAYTHQLAPQQPLGAPQASCAPGGPSITFLPDQTISSRLPCPVSPEAKRYPCLLTRTVRSANLVHREGDTIKTKQGHLLTELTATLPQAYLGTCLSKAPPQAHLPAQLTTAPSLAYPGTCLTKTQSQAHLATGVQSQAYLLTGLTKAQSQAQLVTETAKCLYPAHQAVEVSSKTKSQPLRTGFKASTQPYLHTGSLGTLSRAKTEDRLTQLPAHSYMQGKATQGPCQGSSKTQSMLVPLLASSGHPTCNVESWGDSGVARAQPSTASPAAPSQEELGPVNAGVAGGPARNSAACSVAIGPMTKAAVDPGRSGKLVASVQAVEKIIVRAVVTIQACARGYLVRQTIKVWHQWAVVIQAAWRGYRVRRDLAQLCRAATIIQATWRGYCIRRSCAQQMLPQGTWANVGSRARSTSSHRCFQSCQPHVCAFCQPLSTGLGSFPSVVMLVGSNPRTCHMCGRTLPTRVVQGMGQGTMGQADVHRGCDTQLTHQSTLQLHVQNKAATLIQSAWRGFVVRHQLKRQQVAAKRLQATWRGHFTRASLTTDALLGPAVWDNSQNTQWPGV